MDIEVTDAVIDRIATGRSQGFGGDAPAKHPLHLKPAFRAAKAS
jgi:hypothetical protein